MCLIDGQDSFVYGCIFGIEDTQTDLCKSISKTFVNVDLFLICGVEAR